MCTALSRHATDFHNMPDHQHATTVCPRPPAAGRALQRRTRYLPEHPYFVAPGACGPARKNNGLVKKSHAGRKHHSRPDGGPRRSRAKDRTGGFGPHGTAGPHGRGWTALYANRRTAWDFKVADKSLAGHRRPSRQFTRDLHKPVTGNLTTGHNK